VSLSTVLAEEHHTPSCELRDQKTPAGETGVQCWVAREMEGGSKVPDRVSAIRRDCYTSEIHSFVGAGLGGYKYSARPSRYATISGRGLAGKTRFVDFAVRFVGILILL